MGKREKQVDSDIPIFATGNLDFIVYFPSLNRAIAPRSASSALA